MCFNLTRKEVLLSHFTDEEAEAQQVYTTLPSPSSRKRNPWSNWPESVGTAAMLCCPHLWAPMSHDMLALALQKS